MTPAGAGDGYAQRLEKEISVFEGQDKLHDHAAAFHYYTDQFVGPLLEAAFGRRDLYEIYAESIASAVCRTGLEVVYSLGCGDGEQERAVLAAADRMGLPRFTITGIELAPAVADRANRAAVAAGLADRLTVITHDLNSGLPDTGEVAAVMVHHVLHHIVDLEGLFDRVAGRLHAEGALVTFDMIGRNGHRRWTEVGPLVRQIWAALPPSKRHDYQFGRPSPFFLDWDCAVEGFEGVRAQDILGLLAERFQVSRFASWGGIADIFVSPRFARNFDPALPADRKFLHEIGTLERRLLDQRRTTPASMGAEFRSRRSRATLAPAMEAALHAAIRRPDEAFADLKDAAFCSPYPPQAPAPRPILDAAAQYRLEPGSPVVAALHEGWEEVENDGVWALLDEQFLRFRTSAPVTQVTLSIWSSLPTDRRQAIAATAPDAAAVTTGDLAHGEVAEIQVQSRRPTRDWEIRLTTRTYRHPDLDGGGDLRPLAYRLTAIGLGPAAPGPKNLLGLLRRLFPGSR